MEIILLTIQDTLDLIKATQLRDLMTPFFAAFWLTILIMPLHRVDRRDWITFFTFALYMLASGVTLFLAIPHLLVSDKFSGVKQIVFVLALCPMIGLRWLIVKKGTKNG
jgi:hypothetical protein